MDALRVFIMGPIVVKKGKTEYTFHYDKLVIIKKQKIVREISYTDIRGITYNQKFGWRDLLSALYYNFYRTYNAFVIDLKKQIGISNIVFIRLTNEEFNKIKDVFGMPVEII